MIACPVRFWTTLAVGVATAAGIAFGATAAAASDRFTRDEGRYPARPDRFRRNRKDLRFALLPPADARPDKAEEPEKPPATEAEDAPTVRQ